MKNINVSQARANLFALIDETNETHMPVHILGKRNNAVLISEDDWRSIQETLYISSIPGLKESILKAGEESLDKCTKDFKW